MKVVDRKPVPIYEAECSECHSKIEYKASEVSYTGYITCPVCGSSVWGSICYPVRMDEVVSDFTDEQKFVISGCFRDDEVEE